MDSSCGSRSRRLGWIGVPLCASPPPVGADGSRSCATVIFLLIVLGDTIALWATRKPRTFRVSGFFRCSRASFLPSSAAATLGLRRELKDGEGHSLANLAGLILNVIALGTLASQIITATIWK